MPFFILFCACLLFVTSTASYNSRSYGRYSGYGDSSPYGRRQPGYGPDRFGRYLKSENELTQAEDSDLESDDGNRRDLFDLDPALRICPEGYDLTFGASNPNGECQQDVKNEEEARVYWDDAPKSKYACARVCDQYSRCYAFDWKQGYCYLNTKCHFQDVGDGYLSCKKTPRMQMPVNYFYYPNLDTSVGGIPRGSGSGGFGHGGGGRRNLDSGDERTHALEGKELESDDGNRRDLDVSENCPAGFELTFEFADGECQQNVQNEGETRVEGEAANDIYTCALACRNSASCHAFDFKEGGYCYLNKRCDHQDVGDGYLSCKKSPTSVYNPRSVFSPYSPYSGSFSYSRQPAFFNPNGGYNREHYTFHGYNGYNGGYNPRIYDDLNMDDWFDNDFYGYNYGHPDFFYGYNHGHP